MSKPSVENRDAWKVLRGFEAPSVPGGERSLVEEVVASVEHLNLPDRTLERLKTAVSEAAMNAMEHGNAYASPVSVEVAATSKELRVSITDRGSGPLDAEKSETPDIEAKLKGEQTARGWGLFLIRSMTDGMNVVSDGSHHTVELFFRLEEKDEREGGANGR